MARSGLAVGLNRGFITTEINKKKIRRRPSYRKGKLGKRIAAVRTIVAAVAGSAPYEKRIIELLKTGQAKDQKKARKLCAARLGTNQRGKRKLAQLEGLLREQRRKKEKKEKQ